MLRWIAENYRTLLWAFALAVAVWLAAVTAANPDETRTLSSPIPVEIVGQNPGLVIRGDIPEDVKITLRAPSSVWNQIDADPGIIRAVLDLSGLAVGEHDLDLQIQINTRPLQIISVAPQSVSFTLETLATQVSSVDLNLSGEAAVGYQIGDPILDPQEVVIAGPKSQIQKVKRVRVSVNLNRVREDVELTPRVEVLDDNGLPISGISISPESVHVSIPVNQQGGYRDVAVKVITTGRVASGYRLTDITVYPPLVTVYATNPDLVNNLPGALETQLLDLRNAKDDINTRLSLNLPSGISIVGEQTVLIQAGVSAIESSVTLAGEKVEIIGLANNLNAQVSPPTVDVIASGPLPLLDTLTRQAVRVTVDLSGLAPGIHQVTPSVEVLISDVIIETILPNTIEVVITSIGEALLTPTP